MRKMTGEGFDALQAAETDTARMAVMIWDCDVDDKGERRFGAPADVLKQPMHWIIATAEEVQTYNPELFGDTDAGKVGGDSGSGGTSSPSPSASRTSPVSAGA